MNKQRELLNKKLLDLEYARKKILDEEEYLARDRKHLEACKLAQSVIQSVAQGIQQGVHERIASVVSRCLEAVFQEEAYTLHINFERKRGRTEASFILKRGDVEITDPTKEAGGGVVDVCAFALRLVCLVMSYPPKRRLLVLDEPGKHINGSVYQERVGALILKLAEEFGLQVVISSDDEWLHLGKVIDLEAL